MTRIFGSLLLGIALVAPVAIQAQDTQSQRYYDKTHKDYHQWNDHENSSYHQWLKDNHRKDHEFTKAPKNEQQSYWNYRHQHPDPH